jgi:hypothetical protein
LVVSEIPFAYPLALAVVALCVIVLGVLVFATVRALRAFSATLRAAGLGIGDGVGLIRARIAGVRVALEQRRSKSRAG